MKKNKIKLSSLLKEQEDDEEEKLKKFSSELSKASEQEDDEEDEFGSEYEKEKELDKRTPIQMGLDIPKGAYASLSDRALDQMKLGDDLIKDVKISSFVLKESKPWVIELIVEFYFKPTEKFKHSHTDSRSVYDSEGQEKEEYGRFHFNDFKREIEKLYGKRSVFERIDKLKKELDIKYEKSFPYLDWSFPAIAPLHEKPLEDLVRFGEELKNRRAGYYIRFEIPKRYNEDSAIKKYFLYKIEELKNRIADLNIFKTNENFVLNAGK